MVLLSFTLDMLLKSTQTLQGTTYAQVHMEHKALNRLVGEFIIGIFILQIVALQKRIEPKPGFYHFSEPTRTIVKMIRFWITLLRKTMYKNKDKFLFAVIYLYSLELYYCKHALFSLQQSIRLANVAARISIRVFLCLNNRFTGITSHYFFCFHLHIPQEPFSSY